MSANNPNTAPVMDAVEHAIHATASMLLGVRNPATGRRFTQDDVTSGMVLALFSTLARLHGDTDGAARQSIAACASYIAHDSSPEVVEHALTRLVREYVAALREQAGA